MQSTDEKTAVNLKGATLLSEQKDRPVPENPIKLTKAGALKASRPDPIPYHNILVYTTCMIYC